MIRKQDCRVETMRGTGPGGQHKNKTYSAVRITHRPTGLSAYADERSQKHSRRKAWAELKARFAARKAAELAARRKAKRDEAIRPQMHIRTYNYTSGLVIDHRSGKRVPLKKVLEKGRIDLLC